MTQASTLSALDRAGYRLTRPRRQVAELIGEREGHFTAAELVDAARDRRLGIGRATIFRALETLSALGIVERLDLPSGEHAYVRCEPQAVHHHHVICASCGRSTEVPGCNLAPLAADVAARTGYRVDTHRIELYGTCPECQRSAG